VDRSSQDRRRSSFDDPEAEAHFLRGQLRAEGDLPRLQLWAYLGHKPAQLALDGRALARPVGFLDWFVALGRWGASPVALVAIALANRACVELEDTAPELFTAASAISTALPAVERGDLAVESLRRQFMPFWLRGSKFQSGRSQFAPPPYLVVERAVQLMIASQTKTNKKSLGDIEALADAALRVPGWTHEDLLKETSREVLLEILRRASSSEPRGDSPQGGGDSSRTPPAPPA